MYIHTHVYIIYVYIYIYICYRYVVMSLYCDLSSNVYSYRSAESLEVKKSLL